LTGLALSIGPGSFTGLRVGVATMLGIRSVTCLPLVTVPTLEAMAFRVKAAQGLICPVVKSRAGEVYWALFEWAEKSGLIQTQEERVGTVMDLAGVLEQGTIVTGDGWSRHADEIRDLLAKRQIAVFETSAELMRPSAVAVAERGLARLTQGEVAGAIVTPLYVQRCEAEIKFEKAGAVSPFVRRFRRVAAKRRRRLPVKATRER
jgi:tRNA threonylcarbamoyladenosine biosynthesis protein TsaB